MQEKEGDVESQEVEEDLSQAKKKLKVDSSLQSTSMFTGSKDQVTDSKDQGEENLESITEIKLTNGLHYTTAKPCF